MAEAAGEEVMFRKSFLYAVADTIQLYASRKPRNILNTPWSVIALI